MATLRINVVFSDLKHHTPLIQRLRNYSNRSGEISPEFTEEALPESATDCYVISADRIEELTKPLGRPPTWKPVIAFGPNEGMRKAFVSGCTDYLKEPWPPEELYIRALKNCRSRSHRLPWGSLEIDGLSLRIIAYEEPATPKEIRLTERQVALLEALLALRGSKVSRSLLFYAMWGREASDSRAVDMQISILRSTLGRISTSLGGDRFIRSAYGSGYFID